MTDEKTKVKTQATLIAEVAIKQHKNRKEVVVEVVAKAKKEGIKKNHAKTEITEKNTTTLLGAIMRDMKANKGRWKKWAVKEDENTFQFIAPKQ